MEGKASQLTFPWDLVFCFSIRFATIQGKKYEKYKTST